MDSWLKFFVGIFIILGLAGFGVYELYNLVDYIAETKSNNNTAGEYSDEIFIEDNFSKVEGLHWSHMPISYYIYEECGEYEISRMEQAFDKIQADSYGVITFEKHNSSVVSDIEVKCSFLENCYKKMSHGDSICSHDLSKVQLDIKGNIITKAKIELIGLAEFAETTHKVPSGFVNVTCGYLNRELHALLRAFAYPENSNSDSIMYVLEGFFPGQEQYDIRNCTGNAKEIDLDILSDLVENYGDV